MSAEEALNIRSDSQRYCNGEYKRNMEIHKKEYSSKRWRHTANVANSLERPKVLKLVNKLNNRHT